MNVLHLAISVVVGASSVYSHELRGAPVSDNEGFHASAKSQLKILDKKLVEDPLEEGFPVPSIPFLKAECEMCRVGLECSSLNCEPFVEGLTFNGVTLGQCAGSDGITNGDGCICVFDDDCDSGYCTFGLHCATKLNVGESGCVENDDCLDSYCSKASLPFECTALKGIGSLCAFDGECASGDCEFFTCAGTDAPTTAPTSSPTATPLTPNGEFCTDSSQCESGNCGFGGAFCPVCCIA